MVEICNVHQNNFHSMQIIFNKYFRAEDIEMNLYFSRDEIFLRVSARFRLRELHSCENKCTVCDILIKLIHFEVFSITHLNIEQRNYK